MLGSSARLIVIGTDRVHQLQEWQMRVQIVVEQINITLFVQIVKEQADVRFYSFAIVEFQDDTPQLWDEKD